MLLEQIFVIDGETPIAKVLEKAAKELGAPVEHRRLRALCRGRGHREGRDSDFADEVKSDGRPLSRIAGLDGSWMAATPKYRRVLLKVSGEALMGERGLSASTSARSTASPPM